MLAEINAIAVAELIVYIPALAIAIFLSVRHGLSRSSGWRFLIIFTLARLIQASMQLGTIADPKNLSLFIGTSILLGIAVSPLQLATLGLLSRLIDSINKSQSTLVNPRHIKLLQTISTIGLILSIVGGNDSGSDYGDTGVYKVQDTSKAGLALFIVVFAGIVGITALLGLSVSNAEMGERRILPAIAASLPFMLVRIIYSCLFTFGGVEKYSIFGGDVNALLGMALIMEFVVVVLYEGLGVTLKKQPKQVRAKNDVGAQRRYEQVPLGGVEAQEQRYATRPGR